MSHPSTARKSAPAAHSTKTQKPLWRLFALWPMFSWPTGWEKDESTGKNDYNEKQDFIRLRARLCRGLKQVLLLDLVRSSTEARIRNKKAEPAAPEWSLPTTARETAARLDCTERQVLDDLEDAETRGLMDVRWDGNSYEARFTDLAKWHGLPSYKEWLKAHPKSADKPADEDESTEEERQKAATTEAIPEFQVREGKPSRKHKFEVAPANLRIIVEGGQATISGVRQGLDLDLTVKVASSPVNHLRNRNGSVIPISHLPGVVPEAFLVEAAAVQLSEKIATLGPLLDQRTSEQIVRMLAQIPGAPAEVSALYLEELEVKRKAFERRGGKLESGACMKLAREMPEKWRLRQKAGPAQNHRSEVERLMGVV